MTQYPRKLALPLFAAAVALIWGLLHFHHFGPHDLLDTDLALLIGVGWTIGTLFMLIETEGWTIRALGVLGAIAGDAVLYSYLGGALPKAMLNLARAFLIIGMPLFLIGVVLTIIARCRERRRAPIAADEPRLPSGLP